MYNHFRNQYGSLSNIGNQSTSRPSNTTLGYIPKDAYSYHKDICSALFIAALFQIARTYKQPRHTLIEELIKKRWYIYMMEYYSEVKKKKNNDILKFAWKWMELENSILGVVTQPQNDKHSMHSLISGC